MTTFLRISWYMDHAQLREICGSQLIMPGSKVRVLPFHQSNQVLAVGRSTADSP
jgi:hypothetical protein